MSMHPMQLEVIRREASKLREIVGDDDETFLDTLDGETDAMDIIGALLEALTEAEGYEAANKQIAETYLLRATAMKVRQDSIRSTLLRILEAIGMKSLKHPLASLSWRVGKPELLGDADPDTLPDELCSIRRTASKTAIREALEAGKTVPGMTLGNGRPSLTVRRK